MQPAQYRVESREAGLAHLQGCRHQIKEDKEEGGSGEDLDCEDDEDVSRGQSPMIPLTIERSVAIKEEPSDADFLESVKNEEYEDEEVMEYDQLEEEY